MLNIECIEDRSGFVVVRVTRLGMDAAAATRGGRDHTKTSQH